MDVREPRQPTFTPDKPMSADQKAERERSLWRMEKGVIFPSPLAEKVEALEKRIAVLEEKLKNLVPTLAEATAMLLKVGPEDTVIFTVPLDVDLLNGLHSRLAAELKEDLGVRKVIFAHKGVETSVLSHKE